MGGGKWVVVKWEKKVLVFRLRDRNRLAITVKA